MNITSYMSTEFEEIKHSQEGFEFWMARELMPVLGYKTRQKFKDAIHRAKESCTQSGRIIEDEFLPAPVKTSGELGGRPREKIDKGGG